MAVRIYSSVGTDCCIAMEGSDYLQNMVFGNKTTAQELISGIIHKICRSVQGRFIANVQSDGFLVRPLAVIGAVVSDGSGQNIFADL